MSMVFKYGNQNGQDVIDWIHAVAQQYEMTQDDFEKLMSLYVEFEDTYRKFLIAQVYIQKLETSSTAH